jgi:hypothetical protein
MRRQHQAQERMAPQGEVGPRGLRRIPLRRMARHRQGTVRGRGGGGRQEGGQARIRRRPGGRERRPQRALGKETEFLPITTKAYLYLSGTPFKALATGEFIEEQIFNWTYTDEQRAKEEFAPSTRTSGTPTARCRRCACSPTRCRMSCWHRERRGVRRVRPQRVLRGSGRGKAQFKHKSDVQKWLDIIRGRYAPKSVEHLKTGTRPPFPYSDVRLLPYLQHSFWFLPNVAACHAMANLLAEKHNTFLARLQVVVAAGRAAGIGLDALPPVRKAIGSGFDTKTITLSCGKLTTGVTVPQWSSILMLRNLKSPETYFQAAFRVQSPWSIKNPNGDNPNEEEILKPVCFRVRLRAHARAAAALRVRHRPVAQRAEPGERGQGSRVVPARAGLRRRQHDADRRGRHPRHRDGGHLGHAAGAQVGSPLCS